MVGPPRSASQLLLLAAGSAAAVGILLWLGHGVDRESGPPPAALTLSLVVGAGVLDGLNPCSFAGLLLFASFTIAAVQASLGRVEPDLFGVPPGRRRLLGNGSLYISAIFLTYLLIGLGFLGTVFVLSGYHLVGKIAAIGAIAMGLWTLRDFFLPQARWRLGPPRFLHPHLRTSLQATTPAAIFGGGVLVALCTIPCSGGVYLGILALLSAQTSYGEGAGYLLLYNFMFIVPLLAVLFAVTTPAAYRRLARWRLHRRETISLVLGATMVLLGFVSLLLLS